MNDGEPEAGSEPQEEPNSLPEQSGPEKTGESEDVKKEKDKEEKVKESFELISEYDDYKVFRGETTGTSLLICKWCEHEETNKYKMFAHLNPRTNVYCKKRPRPIDKETTTPAPSRKPETPGEGERSITPEDESILKSPPDPLAILERIILKFPDVKKPHKEWVIAACAEAGDALDSATVYRHLMACKGVSDATARYISQQFSEAMAKDAREFQQFQHTQQFLGGGGYGYGQYGQPVPPMFQGQPQIQWIQTPYGPQPMPMQQPNQRGPPYPQTFQQYPYGPYPYSVMPTPQQQNPELVDLRRGMEAIVRRLEAINTPPSRPKEEDSVTAMIVRAWIDDKKGGKGESDEAKKLQAQLDLMTKKLEAKELNEMRNDIMRKIDSMEAKGAKASDGEMRSLAGTVQELVDRVGNQQVSDEARVALSEITSASRERTQFYTESRQLLAKALDVYAAKEGVRVSDKELERVEKEQAQFSDSELEQLSKDLDEEKSTVEKELKNRKKKG